MSLKNEDVSENIELLLEIVGADKFLEITKMYGGSILYIPTYKSAIRSERNREIINRYNGLNTSQLAREYKMSTTHIKRIVKGERV